MHRQRRLLLVNLIIWLVAGVAGGNVVGDFLKGDYDLGPRNTGCGWCARHRRWHSA